MSVNDCRLSSRTAGSCICPMGKRKNGQDKNLPQPFFIRYCLSFEKSRFCRLIPSKRYEVAVFVLNILDLLDEVSALVINVL